MEVEPNNFYRLMAPRLIALITTVDQDFVVNAAPFSFVMPVSMSPPMLAVALTPKKDTLENVRKTKEFVVNIPTEEILKNLLLCAKDYPKDVNELDVAGLSSIDSQKVSAPRIRECVAWMECKLAFEKECGDHVLVVANVVKAEVKDEALSPDFGIDPSKAKVLLHISGPSFAVAERMLNSKEEKKNEGE